MKRIACLLVLLLAASASADVYRCTDASGSVTFPQTPCAGGADEFSRGALRLVSYVYQYRTTHSISVERKVTLTSTQCETGTLGDVSCSALPGLIRTPAADAAAASRQNAQHRRRVCSAWTTLREPKSSARPRRGPERTPSRVAAFTEKEV